LPALGTFVAPPPGLSFIGGKAWNLEQQTLAKER